METEIRGLWKELRVERDLKSLLQFLIVQPSVSKTFDLGRDGCGCLGITFHLAWPLDPLRQDITDNKTRMHIFL